MTAQEQVGMSIDDFIRQYDQQPFELIDGEWRPIMPSMAEHGEIIRLLQMLLYRYDPDGKRIAIFAEQPYVVVYSTHWVTGSLVPDLMVYDAERIRTYRAENPDWKSRPYTLIPDLCAEVISPGDIYLDVEAKVKHYLSDGVRLVWVFNPRNQTVAVHTAGSNQITLLNLEDTLTGGDVMPEFSAPVRAILADD